MDDAAADAAAAPEEEAVEEEGEKTRVVRGRIGGNADDVSRRLPTGAGAGTSARGGGGCSSDAEIGDAPSASEIFAAGLATLVDDDEVSGMRALQLRTLSNLQDANAVLGSFNAFCDARLPHVAEDLARSAKLVGAIKNDLAYIHSHSR